MRDRSSDDRTYDDHGKCGDITYHDKDGSSHNNEVLNISERCHPIMWKIAVRPFAQLIIHSILISICMILLLGILGCATSTGYVPLSSRVSQRIDKINVEVEMSNKIEFLGSRLQGWSGEVGLILFGFAGYAITQGIRESSDIAVEKQISVENEIDPVELFMTRFKENLLKTGRVGSVEIWKKEAQEISAEKAVPNLKVSIPTWGFKQISEESKLKSFMEVKLSFSSASGNPQFTDYQVITLDTNRNLEDYRKDGDQITSDLIVLIESSSKRIVSLVLN